MEPQLKRRPSDASTSVCWPPNAILASDDAPRPPPAPPERPLEAAPVADETAEAMVAARWDHVGAAAPSAAAKGRAEYRSMI